MLVKLVGLLREKLVLRDLGKVSRKHGVLGLLRVKVNLEQEIRSIHEKHPTFEVLWKNPQWKRIVTRLDHLEFKLRILQENTTKLSENAGID